MPLYPQAPRPALCCLLALFLATALALGACGSSMKEGRSGSSAQSQRSGSGSSSAADRSAEASAVAAASLPESTVVAKVEGTPIDWGELKREMLASVPGHKITGPPAYEPCMAQVHAEPASRKKTTAQLRAKCRERYEVTRERALRSLINSYWVTHEAKQLHLKVDQGAIAHELAEIKKAFAAQIASSGQSLAQIEERLQIQGYSDALYEHVKQITPRVSPSVIAAYYRAHKKDYLLPEQRDLYIIRAFSPAAAQKDMQQVKAGVSFAQLVSESKVAQPIKTHAGLLRGLTPTLFSEPVLAKAIFKARAHVLSGPVKISLGYYVFEVLRTRPAHQQSLAEVSREIAAKLPEQLHEQTLARTVAAFRAKWSARTDCRAGFVVEYCRQFQMPPGGPADPYTF